jgi:hypothetical protein
MASVTLSLTSGTYAVTWTVFNATGSCSYSVATNVTMTTALDGRESEALTSVSTAGGSLTLECQGNDCWCPDDCGVHDHPVSDELGRYGADHASAMQPDRVLEVLRG